MHIKESFGAGESRDGLHPAAGGVTGTILGLAVYHNMMIYPYAHYTCIMRYASHILYTLCIISSTVLSPPMAAPPVGVN